MYRLLCIFLVGYAASLSTITSKVLPPSWFTKPSTFSKINPCGFLSRNILSTWKNIVPRVSANPCRLPAELKAWHGNPAQSTSKSGMSEVSTFVMSPVHTGGHYPPACFSKIQSYHHSNAGLQDRRLGDFLFQNGTADNQRTLRKTLPAG